MARRRDYRAEAARRNERAREQGYSSYYRMRVARARKQHPGISTGAARGHPSEGEAEINRLLKFLRSDIVDPQVHFISQKRNRDGTYGEGVYDVNYIVPGKFDERGKPLAKVESFTIDAATLDPRMDEIADVITSVAGPGHYGWGSP